MRRKVCILPEIHTPAYNFFFVFCSASALRQLTKEYMERTALLLERVKIDDTTSSPRDRDSAK